VGRRARQRARVLALHRRRQDHPPRHDLGSGETGEPTAGEAMRKEARTSLCHVSRQARPISLTEKPSCKSIGRRGRRKVHAPSVVQLSLLQRPTLRFPLPALDLDCPFQSVGAVLTTCPFTRSDGPIGWRRGFEVTQSRSTSGYFEAPNSKASTAAAAVQCSGKSTATASPGDSALGLRRRPEISSSRASACHGSWVAVRMYVSRTGTSVVFAGPRKIVRNFRTNW